MALSLVNPILGASLWLNDWRDASPADSAINRAVAQKYHLGGTLDAPQYKLLAVVDPKALNPF